uniref:Uncharacterized protein n=1 Tax=Anguilla anguilla TaxID=7936 RepID=A0A0E9QAW7_ANGAN
MHVFCCQNQVQNLKILITVATIFNRHKFFHKGNVYKSSALIPRYGKLQVLTSTF